MTLASIDIDAMDRLLSTFRTAGQEFQGRRTDLHGILFSNGLTTGSVVPISTTARWCDDQIPHLTRRLALAHLVQSQDVSLGAVVEIDESMLSDLTPAQAEALAQELAEALNSGRPLSEDQLAILIDHAHDPYFAVTLMNAVPPEQLAVQVDAMSRQHQHDLAHVFPEGDETYEDARNRVVSAYEARLEAFGVALGTASRSVDPPLRSGYADDVVELMTSSTGLDGGNNGLPVAMSVILGHGSYGEDFAATVAEGLYDFERSDDFHTWAGVAGQHGQFTLPGGAQITDVMPGVMTMLGTNPDAAQAFFNGGPTTTIEVDGQQLTVTERLKYLIQDRTWAPGRGSDDGQGLGSALESATTAYRNREATGAMSAEIATQVFSLIAQQTGEGADGGFLGFGADNGWEMWRGMRDSVARMLADYSADMFRTVGDNGHADDLSLGYADAPVDFPPSMPYGALLTEGIVGQLMFTLGQDPQQVETVTTGWALAYHIYTDYQLDLAIAANPDFLQDYARGLERDRWHNRIGQGASVLAVLMDAAYEGDGADADRAQERAEAMERALSMVLAIPALKPGEAISDWGKFAYDQAKSEALKAIKNSGAGHLDTDELNELRSLGADAAQQVVLDQLLAAGYFDPPPPDSILTVDDSGTAVFDTQSQEYQQWILDNAPVAEIRAVVISAFGLEPR